MAMLAIAAVGCLWAAQPGTQRLVISVPGIMCEESCTAATREILMAQPGVLEVDVRFETKTAAVVIDEGSFRVDDSRVLEDAAL